MERTVEDKSDQPWMTDSSLARKRYNRLNKLLIETGESDGGCTQFDPILWDLARESHDEFIQVTASTFKLPSRKRNIVERIVEFVSRK